ncbi:MAG: SGNH/GDSL hydrolase family protein [Bacilli bacterium]
MRIKKLLFISLTVLVVFLVYLSTVDKKVYYLNLGDSIALGKNSYRVRGKSYDYYIKEYLNEQKKLEKFINEFNKEDLRITDLYNMIEDNYKININGHSQSIKNALIKADVVTLTVGNDSFYSKLSGNYSLNELYEIIDEYKEDMEKLLILIKKYCKEDIILLGYYNPYPSQISQQAVHYINNKMRDLAAENKIHYLSLEEIITDKLILNPNDYHMSDRGYQYIGEEIIKIIKKDIL